MNEKVRIITDSGCDISPEAEKEWAKYLVVMPFAVTINGEPYLDRIDITPDEFYKVLKENDEIPKHSQITSILLSTLSTHMARRPAVRHSLPRIISSRNFPT